MIRETSPILASYTGYFTRIPERNYDLEKAKENIQVKAILDEEMTKVQPIYNSQGKVIGYNKDGQKLNVVV